MKRRLFMPLAAIALWGAAAHAAQNPTPAYPTVQAMPPASTAPAAPPAALPPAQAAKPGRRRGGGRQQGQVTAVDLAKQTITITPQDGSAPVTMDLAPDVKIYIPGSGSVSALKVGDRINAFGQATPDAPTLTAERIMVLPAANRRPNAKPADRTTGFRRNGVEGTVATTTPTLTMTTPGNVTVTVNTTPDTKVQTLDVGSLSSITVGQNIQARVNGDPAAPIAKVIQVMPARQARVRRNRKNAAPAAAGAPAAPGAISAQ